MRLLGFGEFFLFDDYRGGLLLTGPEIASHQVVISVIQPPLDPKPPSLPSGDKRARSIRRREPRASLPTPRPANPKGLEPLSTLRDPCQQDFATLRALFACEHQI